MRSADCVSQIRLARPADLPALRRIERAAGQAFRDVAMAAIADHDPLSISELGAFQAEGRAWVSVDVHDRPHAYLLAAPLAESFHIEQVSVDPRHRGHRHGRALISCATQWGSVRGLGDVTLTTFAEVAWNAPYYASIGFEIVPDGCLNRELIAICETERDHGLDRWPRVVMRRRGGA